MHKRLVNQCNIDLEIATEGPLLIKSGLTRLTGPDMAPVVTFRSRQRPEPYIPGSSLKGVIRSHAERIARTLCWEPGNWQVGTCNPFLTDKESKQWEQEGACSGKFDELKKNVREAKRRGEQVEEPTAMDVYRDSCPACKVFGNTSLIGRIAVPDAYLSSDSPDRTEQRDGVGIDRFTGGAASGAKFELEVVTKATFEVQLQLVNFELWQLGWLAYVIRDLSEGQLGIGSGKSRGLGQVSASVRQVELSMVKRLLPNDNPHLWGLSALEPEDAQRAYGYWTAEQDGVSLEGIEPIDDTLGLRRTYQLQEPAAVLDLWEKVAPLATDYLEAYQIPQTMRHQ
jgi:CRISPR-associated RAMP protein (TIGR02581 family)